MHKGHMDKAKGGRIEVGGGYGWGGGEWYGENGDNSICTTMKKKKELQ